MPHSFFNLLFYVWGRTVSVLGTTTTSIIYSFALVVLVFIVQILDKWRTRKEGATFMGVIKEGFGRAILLSIAVYIVLGCLFFLYQTAKFIQQDHQTLLDRITVLKRERQQEKNSLPSKSESEKQTLIINVPPPTVIVKDKPEQRMLTTEQRNKLITLLKAGGNTSITVRHAQGNFEAQTYADYFSSALKDAGWTINEPSLAFETRQGQGVQILVHDLKEPLPLAVLLQNSLRAVGVSADGAEMAMVPSGTFELYIGVQ